MARPQKYINWDLVEEKMEAGCSAKEIAGGICDINTFYDRFKEHYGKSFGDYADEFYRVGDGNIKHTQYVKALAGNNNMLLLLGRERLEQGKEPEKISPFEETMSLQHENMILKSKLAKLEAILNDHQPETRQEL